MNAAVPIENSKFASSEVSDPCTVAVLCDDSTSHSAAMQICERLVTQFDGELLFVFHCWKLKELTSALFSGQIVDTVADADVIIFATRGEDLPYPVRRCLEICTERRVKRDGALGLLLVEPMSPSAAVGTLLSRLEYAAARLRMDFLPMFDAANGPSLSWDKQAKAVSSLLKDMMEQPPSHWGLNE